MEARDQPFERNCDVNLDGEFIISVGWAKRFGLGFDLVEGIADSWVIGLSQLGEFGFSGIAAEELDVEPIFQQFDLMADGRAGYAQFTCRHAEGTEAGGGFKGG